MAPNKETVITEKSKMELGAVVALGILLSGIIAYAVRTEGMAASAEKRLERQADKIKTMDERYVNDVVEIKSDIKAIKVKLGITD